MVKNEVDAVPHQRVCGAVPDGEHWPGDLRPRIFRFPAQLDADAPGFYDQRGNGIHRRDRHG
jgi:hypothetical protein